MGLGSCGGAVQAPPPPDACPPRLAWRCWLQGSPCDFYIVPQPAWLAEKFPDLDKRVRKPAVALISTDPVWIT